MKKRYAWVVDDDGKIIIHAGHIGPELIRAADKSSYIVISFWNSLNDQMADKPMVSRVFPIERVYYGYLEEN